MPKQRATREPPHEAEPTHRDAAGEPMPPDVAATPSSDTPDQPGTTPAPLPERRGLDTRQRGWYWHWNGIVTQYAPLIGLKGVGLLNSYTVWTDRRDQSPTRGYAFPGQQSEADFYGEDRAELITINKILVALDLIEIRKEMVRRTDAQGRKWKVPRNLYRVKDRPEGIELRTADVLRVAELAKRDTAVFRYTRRVFSSRFEPIDANNVWHRILKEIASNLTWQELTEKTARIEARASARSKAGHKARNKQTSKSHPKDVSAQPLTSGQITTVVSTGDEHAGEHPNGAEPALQAATEVRAPQFTSVATDNNGPETDVDGINGGLQSGDASSAEATNNGSPSVVAPSNATYYQETSTTTTTTSEYDDSRDREAKLRSEDAGFQHHAVGRPERTGIAAENPGPAGLDNDPATLQTGDESGVEHTSSATVERSLVDPAGVGPLVDPGPLVVSLFEAANDRRATPLERVLLGELEHDAGVAARAVGETGGDWVAAALREAVSSGSAFVAPKRIREIINRWAAAGDRPGVERVPVPSPATNTDTHVSRAVRLPRGRSAEKVWREVVGELEQVLDAPTHARLFTGSRITAYRAGVVEIEVDSVAVAKLSAEYRPLLERHLERQIGQSVALVFTEVEVEKFEPSQPGVAQIEISRADAEQGQQLWRAVLNEIAPLTNADDLARLRGALPLGQDTEGHIVIGVPTSLAARLIDGRCRQAVETALHSVLGSPATVRVVTRDEWLVHDAPRGRES